MRIGIGGRLRTWRWTNLPLPEQYLVALGAGLAGHHLGHSPSLGGRRSNRVAGSGMLLAGIAIVLWATGSAGQTNLEEPESLVTQGPYGLTRNPMYIGWTLIYLGLAAAIGSRWLLGLSPVAAWLTHRQVVAEENALEARFGDSYLSYRQRVRRYL